MSEVAEAPEVLDHAEVKDGKPIVAYSRTEVALADLTARYKGATFDLTTTKGDKAARAARHELVTLRTALEKKRKEFKAPALEFGRLIDAEAKRIEAQVLALEGPIDAQIKADEERREREAEAKRQAEAARVQKHRDAIAAIRAYIGFAKGLPAARIQLGIDRLEPMLVAEPEEFAPEYEAAKAETLATLRTMHAEAAAREAEAARLEAQRAEQARIAAEQAAEAKRIADEKAELARQRAELEAQQAAIAAAAEDATGARLQAAAASQFEANQQAIAWAQQKAVNAAPGESGWGSVRNFSPSPHALQQGFPCDTAPFASTLTKAIQSAQTERASSAAWLKQANECFAEVAHQSENYEPGLKGWRLDGDGALSVVIGPDIEDLCHALLDHIAKAWGNRFPTQPHMAPAWWADLRAKSDALKALLDDEA
jgi:hypothetical protein